MLTIDCEKSHSKPFNIAIVVSRFNQDVTGRLLNSATETLKAKGFDDSQITVVHVPGAVEIPLVVNQLASKKSYEAIIALGVVIRGETSHYDYVCEQVSQGCQSVMLAHNLPIIFGVLTTESKAQALARAGGEHSDKGVEAVDAACEMVEVMRQI